MCFLNLPTNFQDVNKKFILESCKKYCLHFGVVSQVKPSSNYVASFLKVKMLEKML